MKQFSIIFFALMLFVFSGFSQKSLLSEKEEIDLIKKEFFKKAVENHSIETRTKQSAHHQKSGIADYGPAPSWDWVTSYGGSGMDIARKAAVASDGSLYFTGSFSGEMSIGSNTYTSIGRRDVFLAKFQSNGTFLWLNQFSAQADETIDAHDIHLDSANNIYFTGYFTGDISFEDIFLEGHHAKNLFVASANPAGEITMATVHPTFMAEEIGLKVDVDNEGIIYVLASTDGTVSYASPSLITKFSSDGNLLSDYTNTQNFSDMQIVGEHIYFSGTINQAAYIGDIYLEPKGYGDAFVAKANTNMVFDWAIMGDHEEAFQGDSRGRHLYVSSAEEVYLLGEYRTNVIWGDITLNNYGGFVTKLSSNGNILWAKDVHSILSDFPNDITGNDTFIFISATYSTNGIPENQNLLLSLYMNNGDPGSDTLLSEEAITLNHSPIDNTLVLTQNTDELIQLSTLDDVTLNNQWSLLFGGNSAAAYSVGFGIDKNNYQYNFGYTSNQMNYYGHSIGKGLFLAKQFGADQAQWVVQFLDADQIDASIGKLLTMDTITNSLYIAGEFEKPMEIPGGPTLTPEIGGSFFLLKYDLDGNFLWAIQENASVDDLCLATDFSGNILVSGVFDGTISIGGIELVSEGIYDAFFAKYNSDGDIVWTKRAGGEDMEYSCFVSADAQDNVYITGEFDSYEVTVDDYPITLEDGEGNILFAKFNKDGDIQWVNTKGGSTAHAYADYYGWPTGIHTDPDGNSYIKGWHFDQAHFDDIILTSSINKPYYNNKWNKFAAKFDSDGNTIWAETISEISNSMDYNTFDVDKSGNMYVGLRIRDTTIFSGEYTFINSGRYDLVTAKYSNEGQLEWIKSIEGSSSGSNWINSVVCNDEGFILVSGWFSNALAFDENTAKATNQNGFIGALDITVDINSFKAKSEEIVFDLFPNPTHSQVNIVPKRELSDVCEVTIFDLTGKIISTRIISKASKNVSVDVSTFNQGLYFIRLKSGNRTSTQKLIVR